MTDLSSSELYVLSECRNRATSEGWFYMKPRGGMFDECMKSLITKGVIEADTDQAPTVFYRIRILG